MQSMDCTVQTTAAPDVSIDFAVQQLPGSQLPGLQISHVLGLPRAWHARCLTPQQGNSEVFRDLNFAFQPDCIQDILSQMQAF